MESKEQGAAPTENPTNNVEENKADHIPTEEKFTKEYPALEELSQQDLKKLAKEFGAEDLREFQRSYKDYIKPRVFWDTQPVPKLASKTDENKEGEIDTDHDLAAVPKEPFPLLDSFEWCNVNVNDPDQLSELYTFLYENYVEDEDGMFRFDYSREFLQWALSPPGFFPDWLIGVRVKKSRKMVGFISGIPVHISANKTKVKMAEINFLCVHKKLRANRLAPVLIKEVTRRVHTQNQWQAVYTAGTLIPTPITQAKYFHRSLNPKKLIEVKFSSLPQNSTISRQAKIYKLADEPKIPGIRLMKKKDISAVYKLLNQYLEKFTVHMRFSEEEVKHWLLPRENVVTTYVVEKDNQITDMLSFYSLPSSILQHPKYNKLNAAYSFYNVAKSVSITDLMTDALILAQRDGYDVFNALNIMENTEMFKELKFSQGDGNLYYYLYNWRLNASLNPSDIGIVLL